MATFIWPTDTKRVTSGFRTSLRPDHHGVDIAEGGARPIYAIANGVVSKSYVSNSYGEVIFILHKIDGQEWESVYAHLRTGSRGYNAGDRVKQGAQIGIMGNTGRSSGQHLHFELHKGRWVMNGKVNAVDPLKYLDKDLYKSTKNVISTIQETLNKRYGSKLAVDGIPGPKTKTALIKAFQTELNKQFNARLVVDGKWGPKTKAAAVTIAHGAQGNLTWVLQAMLYFHGYDPSYLDGDFGDLTEATLKKFQRDTNIDDDGQAGKVTFSKLFV